MNSRLGASGLACSLRRTYARRLVTAPGGHDLPQALGNAAPPHTGIAHEEGVSLRDRLYGRLFMRIVYRPTCESPSSSDRLFGKVAKPLFLYVFVFGGRSRRGSAKRSASIWQDPPSTGGAATSLSTTFPPKVIALSQMMSSKSSLDSGGAARNSNGLSLIRPLSREDAKARILRLESDYGRLIEMAVRVCCSGCDDFAFSELLDL